MSMQWAENDIEGLQMEKGDLDAYIAKFKQLA
jgi:hypothetical protein